MLLLLLCGPQDYDLTNPDDWDAMKQCCEDAKSEKITDSDCNSLPPNRPPEKAAPAPDPNAPPQTDDECVAAASSCVCAASMGGNTCCLPAALPPTTHAQPLPHCTPPCWSRAGLVPPAPRFCCSYCMANDYDFKQPADRDLWTQCCEDAKKANVKDPDCDKAQW